MKKVDEIKESTISRAADDEPVFVLRSTDKLAPAAVRSWAVTALNAEVNSEKVLGAMEFAYVMEEWQRTNGCKIPD